MTVWDRPCRVSVAQQAQTVWIATGAWLDRTIEAKGRNANTAIKRWRSLAAAMGDGRNHDDELSAALLELAAQDFSAAALSAFEAAVSGVFVRAAVPMVTEQRRRLAAALRLITPPMPPATFDRAVEIIKTFGG